MHIRLPTRRSLLAIPLAGALVVGGLAANAALDGTETAVAATCAPGFMPVDKVLNEVRQEMAREGEGQLGGEAEAREELTREAVKELPMLAGVPEGEWSQKCVRSQRPESLKELLALFGAR